MVSNGENDVFILKMNQGGNILWTKSIGGTQNDGANDIFVDDLNNIYTTGAFQDTVDFNPNGTEELLSATDYYPYVNQNTFILKFKPFPDGIEAMSESPDFNTYPNPTSGPIQIDLGSMHKSVNITVKNALGQFISSRTYSQIQFIDMNLQGESGLYFLEIQPEKGEFVFVKVLKE